MVLNPDNRWSGPDYYLISLKARVSAVNVFYFLFIDSFGLFLSHPVQRKRLMLVTTLTPCTIVLTCNRSLLYYMSGSTFHFVPLLTNCVSSLNWNNVAWASWCIKSSTICLLLKRFIRLTANKICCFNICHSNNYSNEKTSIVNASI